MQAMASCQLNGDITENVQIETNKILRYVLDNIPVSVFWKDRYGVFLGCNQAFAIDAGVKSPKEVIGKTDYELASPAHANFFQHDDVIVMKSGAPKFVYSIPFDRPDGKTHWLMTSKVPMRDEEGKIIGVLGAHQDVTDRKQAEDELVESKERFQAIFNGSDDAIFVHQLKEEGFSPFLEVNKVACERYGYTYNEFLNLSAYDITVKPDVYGHAQSSHRKELLIKRQLIFETHHIKKSGETFPVEINSNIFYQNKQPFIIAVVRDITKRKEAEKNEMRLLLGCKMHWIMSKPCMGCYQYALNAKKNSG